FPRSQFTSAKTPREMAVLMRGQPKAAVPLLETGEITRWFQANGWNYPVRGTPARGVAGVQQFFEAMGLSKPPPVQVTQPELRFVCQYPESVRGQVSIHTPVKKWVYASVESDSDWLRVLTPQPAGPQQATIGFEVDSRQVSGSRADGRLNIIANAGQNLAVRVGVDVRGARRAARGKGFLQPILTMAAAFLLLRLALVPFVDMLGRGTAARWAAERTKTGQGAGILLTEDSHLKRVGGWLALPWNRILTVSEPLLSVKLIDPKALELELFDTESFRHYFVSYFLRILVLCTWWIGSVWGAIVMARRDGPLDVGWGIVAGAAAGFMISASVACLFLIFEMLPLALWPTG